jgi:F0F1-type ATP synthase assembly protein I
MTELQSDAVYCHRCGTAAGAPPDRGEQLRQLELRLMEAETQKAELEVRWAREREEQRSESASKAKAARALGYNLVGVAVLLLMLGYLFACALWLRQTRLEGAGAWILAVLIVGFVMAIALLVASEIIESAAKREQEREHGRELNLEDVKLDGGGTPS